MVDEKSDPGAWADHLASTGRFRAVAAPAWKLVPVEPTDDMAGAFLYRPDRLFAERYASMLAAAPEPPPSRDVVAEVELKDAEIERLEKRVMKAEIEAMKNEAQLRADNERLRDKALAYDLDQAGIERRAAEAVELVEARAEIARLRELIDEARDIIVSAAPGQEVWLDAADEALRGEGE
jgi:hypothetical protein